LDESQFLAEDSRRIESQPSDDPKMISNYYTMYMELPFGTFKIDKVVKHKAKDFILAPNEYQVVIEPE
jgi:hypothetical protein